MSEVLPTFSQATLRDMFQLTYSQVSAAGDSPCASQDGPPIGIAGQGRHPVSPTPSPGKGKRRKTKGTSGLKCTGSSASADLTQFLGNKCRELLGTVGSMEYVQTWKEKVTPLGLRYWEHTALAHRTSDSDCSGVVFGWATPASNEFEIRDVERMLERRAEVLAKHNNGNGFGMTLGMQVMAMLSGWPTPNSRPLNEQVVMLAGPTSESSPAATGSSAGFQLNPAFSAWLMGYPQDQATPGWDTCSPGWSSWVTAQKMLAEYCEKQEATAPID